MTAQKPINFSWALEQETNRVVYRICGDKHAWWKKACFENMHNAIFSDKGVLALWKGNISQERSPQRGNPKFVAMWIEGEPWALIMKKPERVAAIIPQHYLDGFEEMKPNTASQKKEIDRLTNELESFYQNAESHELLDDLPQKDNWSNRVAVHIASSAVSTSNNQETESPEISLIDNDVDPFELDEDLRERTLRDIAIRQGQAAFREALLLAYEYRCAISGCDVKDTLEAAHIAPYKGIHTNTIQNGILLRGDLHTLFDLGLMTINPQDMSIRLSNSIRNSAYANLHGSKFHLPKSTSMRPNLALIERHAREVFVDK